MLVVEKVAGDVVGEGVIVKLDAAPPLEFGVKETSILPSL